jgi:hypothetical protein
MKAEAMKKQEEEKKKEQGEGEETQEGCKVFRDVFYALVTETLKNGG